MHGFEFLFIQIDLFRKSEFNEHFWIEFEAIKKERANVVIGINELIELKEENKKTSISCRNKSFSLSNKKNIDFFSWKNWSKYNFAPDSIKTTFDLLYTADEKFSHYIFGIPSNSVNVTKFLYIHNALYSAPFFLNIWTNKFTGISKRIFLL